MVKIIATLALTSVALFASEGTDIVPRTLNFIIFATILWFLLADPIKNFFTGRTADIAAQLDDVQKKLQESKERKISAAQRVEEAKIFAQNLKESTIKEQKILEEQYETQNKADIEILKKQHEALKDLASRNMAREVVSDIMKDVSKQSSLTQEKMAQIILKKAA